MFKKILVPVDGSPTANRGLKEAIALAKEQGTMLYLLHVIDEHRVDLAGAEVGGAYVAAATEALMKNGQKIIAAAQARAEKQGVRAISLTVETLGQTVAHMILAQAKKHKVDLIVLGTHGRRGLRRIIMGSDAEDVIRQTPVPVLLIRAQ